MAKKTAKSAKKKTVKKSVKKTSAAFDPSALYSHHQDILYRSPTTEEVTVIRVDDMDYFYKIDSWAARLWILLDGKTTLGEVCEMLEKESGFESAFVEQSVNKVIKELESENLITKNG